MLHWLYPNPAWQTEARGRLSFLENGKELGLRFAFSVGSFIGLRLYVPRRLGTSAVVLFLARDGETQVMRFPLRLCGGDGRFDMYAVLLDCATLSPSIGLFFGNITLETIYGPLSVCRTVGDEVCFVAASLKNAFPMLFCDGPMPTRAMPAGCLYALPIGEVGHLGRLFCGEDGDLATFFSHLRALGVRALWLSPSAENREGNGRWDPSKLPPAFRALAEESGIRLLFDLLLCSDVQEEGSLLSSPAPAWPAGLGVDDHPGFWNTPLLPRGEMRSLQEYFCGAGGVLPRLLAAGAGGFVLRAADRFGDALLQAMHRSLQGQILIGAAEGGPFPIRFGTRRRALFEGGLDVVFDDTLRAACLAYLAEGETALLYHYLGDVLPAMPQHVLALQAQMLSSYDEGSFLSALQERCSGEEMGGGAEVLRQLAELGHLIAGTLPGMPLYLAGEENGLPYPPTQGEAIGGQLAFFLRLGQLRRREAVYRDGLLRLLHLSPFLLVFSREREGEALLTVINRSPHRLHVASPDGFSVSFGGRGLKNVFTVRPYGGAVLKVAHWEGEPCRLRFTQQTVARATTVLSTPQPLCAVKR